MGVSSDKLELVRLYTSVSFVRMSHSAKAVSSLVGTSNIHSFAKVEAKRNGENVRIEK